MPDAPSSRFEALEQLQRRVLRWLVLGTLALVGVWGWLSYKVVQTQGELREARAQRDQATDERDDLQTRKQVLAGEVVALREERAQLEREVDAKRAELETLSGFAVGDRRVEVFWERGVTTARRSEARCIDGSVHSPNGRRSSASCAEPMAAGRPVSEGQIVGGPMLQWWPVGTGRIPDCGCLAVVQAAKRTGNPRNPGPALPNLPALNAAPELVRAPVRLTIALNRPPGLDTKKLEGWVREDLGDLLGEKVGVPLAVTLVTRPREPAPRQSGLAWCGGSLAEKAAQEVQRHREGSPIPAEEPDCDRDAPPRVELTLAPAALADVDVNTCWDAESEFRASKGFFAPRSPDRRCRFTVALKGPNGSVETCPLPEAGEGPLTDAWCPLADRAGKYRVERAWNEDTDSPTTFNPDGTPQDDELTCEPRPPAPGTWRCSRTSEGEVFQSFTFTVADR